MDIGMTFFDTKTLCFGEVLFQDGTVYVAKYYKVSELGFLENNGYGQVVGINKIFGKKNITDYFSKKIKELEDKKSTFTKEAYMDSIRPKLQKLSQKITNESVEIANISRKQTVEYSLNRERQLKCISKNIRRCTRNMKRLQSETNSMDRQIESIQKKIENLERLSLLVKNL